LRLLELSLRNYRVFEEVDLELPARVIGVVGPNGAGKSTLVESILFALYGVDGARTKKDGIRTHGVLTECAVRLVFEHGGRQYEVRRTISGKSHKPDAELYVGSKLLATGVSEVDQEVRRALHMDLRVFKASVFAEQKQLDAFSDVTVGRRKEMALRLLGIKPVDDARTAARREARAAKHNAEQLAGMLTDLAALEAELKEALEAAHEAAAKAVSAVATRALAEERSRTARVAFDRSDEVRQRVETLTVEIRGTTERRDDLAARRDRLAERLGAVEAELGSLGELERQLAALDGSTARLEAARRLEERMAEIERVTQQIGAIGATDAAAARLDLETAAETLREATTAQARARLEEEHAAAMLAEAEERVARADEADPSEPCPTCGRTLGPDFNSYVRHRRAERKAAAGRVTAARKERLAQERAATAAAAANQRAAAAAELARAAADRRTMLEDRARELHGEVDGALGGFGGLVPDAAALEAAVLLERELAERVTELRTRATHRAQTAEDLASVVEQLEAAEGKLRALVEDADGLAFDPAAHDALALDLRAAEAALEDARAAERAAGAAEGTAAKDVERLTGRLQEATETERRAGELRDDARMLDRVAALLDGFRDHLVSRVGPELSREAEALFRELTNHEYDDLKIDEDDLSILIADGNSYFPIERFSGSEADLANLALRVAISAHLSRVSGADIGLLIMDEVLGSLDQERKDLMIQAMGTLAQRFHQLFVVTHAEQVKDRFPASILVAKVGRRRSVALPV
jgi:DNA repair protein SbcC/Rad50